MFRLKTFDWSLIVLPLILTLLSITTIYTITYNTVGTKLAMSQTIYTLIGFVLLGVFTFIDYRQFRSISTLLFIVGLALLVPMLPAISTKLPFVICEFNACRWINFGFFQFQTSEFFKLVVILVFAAFLSRRHAKMPWWHIFFYLIALAVPGLLILAQPDLGSALVVIACGLALLLAARFPWGVWVVLFVCALVAMPVVWKNLKPYQQQRIEVFLNPESDPNKTGYNVRQAEIAVGSGGVLGRGFGKGTQSQLNFLPVAHTDFIFAGYAEATGFVGSLFLIGVMMLLVLRALHVAQISKDSFGRYVAIGIAALITVQVVVNIGMNIRLMPVTGIPLPLVSYGGTSMFITMIALGILQSIAIRHKKLDFS